jgi:hypothetical protein
MILTESKNMKLQSWNTIFEVNDMPENSQPTSQNPRNEKFGGQTPTTAGSLNQSGDVENQNQGHNVKKQALGPNTKR